MLREQRRPAEAQARGNAPERLTSGRCAARERRASEVTRHNTGSRAPAGGLARHPLEARRAAWLPPPHAPVPSDATGRRPNGTHPPQPGEHVLVGAAVRGASGDPRPSRATHGGERRGAIVPPTPTMTAGWHASPHQQRPPASAHRDPPTRKPCKTSARPAHPTRTGTADAGTPGLGTPMGRQTVAAHRGMSPRTCLWGCHRGGLAPQHMPPPVHAEGCYLAGFGLPQSCGVPGPTPRATWHPSAPTRLVTCRHHRSGHGHAHHCRPPARREWCTALRVARSAGDGGGHPPSRSGGPGHGVRRCLPGAPPGSRRSRPRSAAADGMAGGDRTPTARAHPSEHPPRGKRSAWPGLCGVASPAVSGRQTPSRERPPRPSTSRGQHPDHPGPGQQTGAPRGVGSRHARRSTLAPSGLAPQAQPHQTRLGQLLSHWGLSRDLWARGSSPLGAAACLGAQATPHHSGTVGGEPVRAPTRILPGVCHATPPSASDVPRLPSGHRQAAPRENRRPSASGRGGLGVLESTTRARPDGQASTGHPEHTTGRALPLLSTVLPPC